MAQTLQIEWTNDDPNATRHKVEVQIDAGSWDHHAWVDMPTATTTYQAGEGADYKARVQAYNGDVAGGILEASVTHYIPELIQKFDSADTVLSDPADWEQEAGTVSHYATGGGDGTARYFFNLYDLGWTDEDIDIYVKLANVTGETESTVTSIVVDSPSLPPLTAAADPWINFPEGTITTVDKIALTSTAGVPIYYTTNGDTPTDQDTLYTEPFALTAGDPKTVKAIATGGGYSASGETTKDYTVNDAGTNMLAFPGAEGYGRFSIGGRGGTVYVVDTLDATGPGSFKYICESSGPRIVVFNIGGIIDLNNDNIIIDDDRISIFGQTAPAPGITIIKGSLNSRASDVVMQHMRWRRGTGLTCRQDAAETNRKSGSDTGSDVIVDHCSFSWGIDETFSINGYDRQTVQWCIISESIANDPEQDEPDHNFGMLAAWWGNYGAVIKCLFTHHRVRSPYISGFDNVDVINNVAYNYEIGIQFNAADNSPFTSNVIGNYCHNGPDGAAANYKGIWIHGRDNPNATEENADASSIYIKGNYDDDYRRLDSDSEYACVDQRDGWPYEPIAALQNLSAPIDSAPVSTTTALIAYDQVLAGAGATLPERDLIDIGQVEDVTNKTGGWVNYPVTNTKYGRYPDWGQTNHTGGDVLTSNGMTAAWEASHGTDPTTVKHSEGWTNIECFVHGITPDQ